MEAIAERSGRLVAVAARRYDSIRAAGAIPLALRATIAVAAAVALFAMSRAEWHQVDVFFWLAMIAGAGAVVLPGSAAPLTMIISILFTWLIHADGEVDGALVVVAVSIGVLHVVCALAASMPLAAAAGVDVLRPWFAVLTAIVAATVLGALGFDALIDAELDGAWLVMLLPIVGTAGLALWWARPPDDPRSTTRR